MKLLQRIIPVILIIIFVYILLLNFIFPNMEHVTNTSFLFPNFLSIFFIAVVFFAIYKKKSKKDFTSKKYFLFLLIISIIVFLFQLTIVICCRFSNAWDPGLIERNVDYFMTNNKLLDIDYMTRYPNNILLTFILVIIKSIPFFGKYRTFTLAINCLLVTLTGVCTSLTIKNIFKNNKVAIFSYLVIVPLILLSPWILVAYSDTFAIIFPILIIYIYTLENKKLVHTFLILFLSIIGYFIKPTVIITLMAIIIVEAFSKFPVLFKRHEFNFRSIFIFTTVSLLGIILPVFMNKAAVYYLNFEPLNDVVEFNMLHYLAMGQNQETYGVYSEEDFNDSKNNGMSQNLDKFLDRITSRTVKEQIIFFSKKTLTNFNNGNFAWGGEGSFYTYIYPTKNKFILLVRDIVYDHGKYYRIFELIRQWLWLLLLFFIPFSVKKNNNKAELVIMLSLIGMTLFLTLFEARARYLYCYSPIFLVCFLVGIIHLKDLMIKKKR